jgi:hypothetical protein
LRKERRDREPDEWRRIPASRATITFLTVEELEQVSAELAAILDRYWDRLENPGLRPEGSRAVRLFLATYLPQTLPRKE